ncbi:hypothetical protein P7K49_009297, partial [Saguinus oedipus]
RRCPLPPGAGTAGPFIVASGGAGQAGPGPGRPRPPAGRPRARLQGSPAGETVAPAPPPGGAGSRLPHSGKLPPRPPGVHALDRPRLPALRAPQPRAAPSGAVPAPRSASWPCPGTGALGPRAPIQYRPPPFSRPPPPSARTPTPPARTPAGQRHPAASRNLTPSSASCAPPRPAANFLRPTSERAGRPDGPAGREEGREGSPRRARRSPQVPRRRGPRGPHSGARPAYDPARRSPSTPAPSLTPTPRVHGRRGGGGGRADRGRGRPGDVSLAAQRGRPRLPDGPARALPLQGPAKFLTCSRRRERAEAAAFAAAAEPGEVSRPRLRRETAPEQLQAPRPRRRPPRPPSAPAARWLRARVWSRGTFCLGAGERPPPPGSPPPAFPTRASHSSSHLFPLVRTPPLCR